MLTLDDRLGSIVRAAREPIVGQMRLTWWYEALGALGEGAPPPEPALRAVHAAVISTDVTGAMLAGMIDGWEMLLDPEPLDNAALATYAAARGGTLFAAAATACKAEATQTRTAGEGWALADLACHLRDPDETERARHLANERFGAAFATGWPRSMRGLGALALLARFDVMTPPPPRAGPRRVLRLLRHRLNGT